MTYKLASWCFGIAGMHPIKREGCRLSGTAPLLVRYKLEAQARDSLTVKHTR